MEKSITDRSNEDVINGSPSSDGSKMVIKLKIPKVSEGEKPDVKSSLNKEDETMKNQGGKRVCSECKKEFSSGKALGGHMRIHVDKTTFLKPSRTTKYKKPSSSSFDRNQDHDHDLNNGGFILNLNQKEEKRKPDYMRCVNDEGKPTCSLCGKIFPSMKSLFGHMRCHPDRLWRGILPPPNTTTAAAVLPRRVLVGDKSKSNSLDSLSEINGLSSNEEDSNNTVDEVVDLTKFLNGWSVTERRGRPAVKEAVEEEEDDDDVLLEAVEDLMNLANSDQSVVTQPQLRVDFEGSNSNNSLYKIDENLPSVDLRLTDYGNGKGKAIMEEEISPSKMEFIDESDNIRNTKNELVLINYNKQKKNPYKKRKKMKLMMELDKGGVFSGGSTPPPPLVLSIGLPPPPSTESKYKCTTCNKCFATHQALGGHRSSHNKSKLTSAENRRQIDQEQDYENESFLMNHSGQNIEFSGEIMLTLGDVVNSTNNIHRCKHCAKNFPTGQALGGHKRCHWHGTTTGSQVTSTGEAASQTGSGRKVLDFDLNEVPSTMLEEDEAGTGNGYASSSYNSYIG